MPQLPPGVENQFSMVSGSNKASALQIGQPLHGLPSLRGDVSWVCHYHLTASPLLAQGCASVGVVASVRDPYAAMAIGQQTVVTSIKTADAALQPPRTYGQPNEEPPFWVEPRQVPIVKLG